MTLARWKKIEELYHAALQVPREARATFLDGACAGDLPLRREVESLIQEAEGTSGFLERSAMDVEAESVARQATPSDTPEKLLQLGSRYEILEEAGRGGMGVVFRARDRETDEIVALKVLRKDTGADSQLMERFRTELKLARRVTHRNVCRIYDLNHVGDVSYIS